MHRRLEDMQIDPISPAGGAVVTGIDLKTDLSPENANSIRNAFLEYGVIAIRDQNMEADDQIKFCNAMGGDCSTWQTSKSTRKRR